MYDANSEEVCLLTSEDRKRERGKGREGGGLLDYTLFFLRYVILSKPFQRPLRRISNPKKKELRERRRRRVVENNDKP